MILIYCHRTGYSFPCHCKHHSFLPLQGPPSSCHCAPFPLSCHCEARFVSRGNLRAPMCCHCEHHEVVRGNLSFGVPSFSFVWSPSLVIASLRSRRGNLAFGTPNTFWVTEIAASGQKTPFLAMTAGGAWSPQDDRWGLVAPKVCHCERFVL